MNLSDRLKKLRAAKGWSATDLATKAGVSRRSIGYLEDENMQPRMGTLNKLARALGVSVSELVAK
jgi:transcriptional regulator with XRE-family HTH domain